MGMKQPVESGKHSNVNAWWGSTAALATRNELHEADMRHNRQAGSTGADDMSSDATDEACFEHMADDVDPQALVGRRVKFPVEALFGDDAMPEGCDPHAMSTLQSYRPG